MHIEFLVEEASMKITLENIISKIVGDNVTFDIHDFKGKHNLLKKLPNRLQGYNQLLKDQKDWKVVVMVDEDREDCHELKKKLEKIAKAKGLTTPSTKENFQVLNRIIVEELEAWFFGDIQAIRKNYPRVSENLTKKQIYRDVDKIKGGTCEALERVLSDAGYYKKGYYPKTEVARNISPFLNPEINSSKSFRVFCEGLKRLLS